MNIVLKSVDTLKKNAANKGPKVVSEELGVQIEKLHKIKSDVSLFYSIFIYLVLKLT